MIDLGVNAGYVAKHLHGTYPLGHVKLLNRAIDSLEITKNGKVSMETLTREAFQVVEKWADSHARPFNPWTKIIHPRR